MDWCVDNLDDNYSSYYDITVWKKDDPGDI